MSGDRAERVAEIRTLFQQLTWRGRQHLARRVDAYGLTVAQYQVLATIHRLGPRVTMGEVSETLQLPASTMTSITDRLVREGFAERGSLPNDRRAVVASITPDGAELVRTIEAARHLDLVGMLAEVSDGDLERFRSVLAHLLDGVERVLADGGRPDVAA